MTFTKVLKVASFSKNPHDYVAKRGLKEKTGLKDF